MEEEEKRMIKEKEERGRSRGIEDEEGREVRRK